MILKPRCCSVRTPLKSLREFAPEPVLRQTWRFAPGSWYVAVSPLSSVRANGTVHVFVCHPSSRIVGGSDSAGGRHRHVQAAVPNPCLLDGLPTVVTPRLSVSSPLDSVNASDRCLACCSANIFVAWSTIAPKLYLCYISSSSTATTFLEIQHRPRTPNPLRGLCPSHHSLLRPYWIALRFALSSAWSSSR